MFGLPSKNLGQRRRESPLAASWAAIRQSSAPPAQEEQRRRVDRSSARSSAGIFFRACECAVPDVRSSRGPLGSTRWYPVAETPQSPGKKELSSSSPVRFIGSWACQHDLWPGSFFERLDGSDRFRCVPTRLSALRTPGSFRSATHKQMAIPTDVFGRGSVGPRIARDFDGDTQPAFAKSGTAFASLDG